MKKKKTTQILLIIMGVLILVELVSSICTLTSSNLIRSLCKIISLTFIALYGFFLYKKPHGNMLKYSMLLLAISEITTAIQSIRYELINFYLNLAWVFVGVVLVYVSGRLNRVEQNKYLLTIAAIVQFIVAIVCVILGVGTRTPLRFFTWFSGAISIVTLLIAYIVRCQEHKEAGLEDKLNKISKK